jgi:trehalose 6-phosphate phosphatase
MPETTRRPLIEVAKRYGVVACVSGRRASDARRVVSLGSIAYLGSHGSEMLRPRARSRRSSTASCRPGAAGAGFADEQFASRCGACASASRTRRRSPPALARGARRGRAPRRRCARSRGRRGAGLQRHWGRKVLEIRPPVRIDKGAGIVSLLRDTPARRGVYVGDDAPISTPSAASTSSSSSGSLKTRAARRGALRRGAVRLSERGPT